MSPLDSLTSGHSHFASGSDEAKQVQEALAQLTALGLTPASTERKAVNEQLTEADKENLRNSSVLSAETSEEIRGILNFLRGDQK